MPAHTKPPASKKCRHCSNPFRSSYAHECLCAKCRASLPKCGSCHAVMAPEYGFFEGFARKVGKYSICSGCNYELRHKGFLHISEFQWLLPSGKVKTSPPRRLRPTPALSKDD